MKLPKDLLGSKPLKKEGLNRKPEQTHRFGVFAENKFHEDDTLNLICHRISNEIILKEKKTGEAAIYRNNDMISKIDIESLRLLRQIILTHHIQYFQDFFELNKPINYEYGTLIGDDFKEEDVLWMFHWRIVDELVFREHKGIKGGFFSKKDAISELTNEILLLLHNFVSRIRIKYFGNSDT